MRYRLLLRFKKVILNVHHEFSITGKSHPIFDVDEVFYTTQTYILGTSNGFSHVDSLNRIPKRFTKDSIV